MLTPQNNEEGYRKTGPRFAGKEIHGNILILHGLTDDNVHVQNSVQLAYELQEAGTPFEMMFYPRARHGITDAKFICHAPADAGLHPAQFKTRNPKTRNQKRGGAN